MNELNLPLFSNDQNRTVFMPIPETEQYKCKVRERENISIIIIM